MAIAGVWLWPPGSVGRWLLTARPVVRADPYTQIPQQTDLPQILKADFRGNKKSVVINKGMRVRILRGTGGLEDWRPGHRW